MKINNEFIILFCVIAVLSFSFKIKDDHHELSNILVQNFDPLIASNSTQETKTLYNRLVKGYGNYVISGQTTKYYDQLANQINMHPIIRGFDMQNYSPHNPWFNWQPFDDGTTKNAIDWYLSTNKTGIVSFQWHWFSPLGGQLRTSTFYTNYTNFNLSKAIQVGTLQYNQTIFNIDAIAIQLKILRDAKVPLLWRPLHQAGGGWFWWGSKTSKETLSLYNIMQKRLIQYHQINNLIWIWSTPQPSWYPGNLIIDMLGFDSYPGAYNYTCNQFRYFELVKLTQGKKMVQLTQNGPIPNFGSCLNSGVFWGYFMSWADLVVSENSIDHIKQVYGRKDVIKTLQNLDIQAV